MSNQSYFILGTDTDCGKTYVTCQLVDYFKQNNQRVLAIKPISSGGIEDVESLNRHNEKKPDESLFWRFKNPISPHLASAEEGVTLSVSAIASVCQKFQTNESDNDLLPSPACGRRVGDEGERGTGILLIEGAGGLMVPLNEHETWVEFLLQTKIPVILVVGMRLGCLNHALLTQAVLNMHGIQCEGWIANCIDPEMQALSENIATLARLLTFRHLATLPYNGRISKSRFSFTINR